MNSLLRAKGLSRNGASSWGWGWGASALLYAAFAAAVFVVQGSQPTLGSDHLSYFQLADSMLASCPQGDYWRETTSTRSFGVLLAYLHGWTGSHVLSMKLILGAFTVFYLLAAELFFSIFAGARWQAVLFAVLSAFAVSFGISSWGVTDSTALLPRTLVAPLVMLSAWLWFRFDGRPARYLAFTLLVLASLLHLSAFYMIGVLVLVEIWDVVALREEGAGRRVPAFVGGLALAVATLFALEYAGVSSKMIGVHIPDMLRSVGIKVDNLDNRPPHQCRKSAGPTPADAALPPPRLSSVAAPAAAQSPPPPLSAKEAWAVELSLRPWRNMPLPMVNVANALSSSALIILLAVAGLVSARRAGFTRVDRLMLAMFVAVPLFALGPQTVLWVLRSFMPVYPATIEEVRALGLIMIPALYFVLRLFRRVLEAGGPRAPLKAAAVALAVVALPLFMKSLPAWAREGILSAMATVRVVDPSSAPGMANARTALGLSAASAPFYYSTQGVREWLARNTPPGARILTNRDDLILLRERVIVGTRQVGATAYYATQEEARLFLETSQAMAARDAKRVSELARAYGADYVVLPWPLEGALFSDPNFSVLRVPRDASRT